MNREIKFRGKSLNGEWKFGLIKTINRNSGIAVLTEDKTNVIREVWKCYLDTIGQFTGLKDKKGIEIYEGDIVSSGATTGIVVYDCEQAGFVVQKEKSIELRFYSLVGIEVIGNIHDNPELLQ